MNKSPFSCVCVCLCIIYIASLLIRCEERERERRERDTTHNEKETTQVESRAHSFCSAYSTMHGASDPLLPVRKAPRAATERLLSLDLMRGAIMVVMAWDHSVDILSDGKLPRDSGFQAWSGHLATYDESGGLFLARFISSWTSLPRQVLRYLSPTAFAIC